MSGCNHNLLVNCDIILIEDSDKILMDTWGPLLDPCGKLSPMGPYGSTLNRLCWGYLK